MKGTYPEAFVGGNPLDKMGVKAGDMELVKAPLDFFGMNYYQRTIIAAAEPDKNRPGVELIIVIAAGRMGQRRTWAGRFGRTDFTNC
jgi:beta-glucosidase/6-phospho-beta-glucosidase/beta-galactosidase